MQPTTLRPLGLGEMLDRSIGLYLRNLRTTAAILGIGAVGFVMATLSLLAVGALTPLAAPRFLPLAIALALVGVVGALGFMSWLATALICVLTEAYLGRPIDVSQAFRRAAERWLSVARLALAIFAGAFAIVAVIAGLVAAVVAGLAGVVRFAPVFVGIVSVLLGVPFVVALFAGDLILSQLLQIATIGCVSEGTAVFTSLANATRRAISHGGWKRALALGAFNVAVSMALSTISDVSIALLQLVGAMAAAATAGVLLLITQLLSVGYALALGVVYYYDTRVRLEGYDLELATSSLDVPDTPAGAAPNLPA